MSGHYKKVVKPVQPPVRFSDAVREWGDQWALSMGLSRHHEFTHDTIDSSLMVLMEKGAIGRVA